MQSAGDWYSQWLYVVLHQFPIFEVSQSAALEHPHVMLRQTGLLASTHCEFDVDGPQAPVVGSQKGPAALYAHSFRGADEVLGSSSNAMRVARRKLGTAFAAQGHDDQAASGVLQLTDRLSCEAHVPERVEIPATVTLLMSDCPRPKG